MDSRRKLALEVASGISLSEACRRAGVTRPIGRKWVRRAQVEGIATMAERSRAPKQVSGKTPPEVEQALVALKHEYPVWGAKKLVTLLNVHQGIQLPLRTADRILKRHGLVNPREPVSELRRFERETCGALLQMDFKGLPHGTPYALLTVIDDATRFCLHFGPVLDKSGPSVCAALWELFKEHGLPDEMLMDNGDCWGSPRAKGPNRFEAWLMRLGIKPIHGRPYHPRTQGKVERFHETAKLEVPGSVVHATPELARQACRTFVDRYNWIRPHESLNQNVPGSRYQPWPTPCPAVPPAHQIPEGAVTRKVSDEGDFCFKGKYHSISKGLNGERIVLTETEQGFEVSYAGFVLFTLPNA